MKCIKSQAAHMNNQDYKVTKYRRPFVGSEEDPIDLTCDDDEVSFTCSNEVLYDGLIEILFSSDDSRDESTNDSSDDSSDDSSSDSSDNSSDDSSDDSSDVIDVDDDEKVNYKGTVGSAYPNSKKSPYFFDSTDSDTDN